MSVFVDTSALLAVVHSGDENHVRASRSFRAFHFDRHFREQGFASA